MGAMPEVLAGGLAAGAVAALGLTLNASIRQPAALTSPC